MTPVGTTDNPLVVAIVGAGPSGFYAAESLVKSDLNVHVNIVEKLPAPFGLVRYGVAPDHPKLKQVSLVFNKIAQEPNVSYFGNVIVGSDVTIDELKETHHAVILCNGAASDRRLDIPGEDMPGSHTATEFVAWYNGHPDYRDHEFDLSQEAAIIIGQGNVAADVCRILSKPVDELRHTDIADHALQQLAESKVRDVHVVGRRGPAQAKFTTKELRELGTLTGCSTTVNEHRFVLDAEDREELAVKTNDNANKCVGIFEDFGTAHQHDINKRLNFDFLLSPQEMTGDKHLEKIRFEINSLSGAPFSRSANGTGETIEIDCGLCFRSIGYRGTPMVGVPFDNRRALYPNTSGRINHLDNSPVGQLYTSGWIKRGPSGVIGTNRADSVETIATLLSDVDELSKLSARRAAALSELLKSRKVTSVCYEQWQLIDAAEAQSGKNSGKPREKITDINQMLAIAG